MTLFVDPACNILYSSFYLQGLRQLYGNCNVHFCNLPFRGLHYGIDTHIFAFVINNRKYCIDFADSNKVFYPGFIEWADVYAKVNYLQGNVPTQYQSKIVCCGCNFAVCIIKHRAVAVLYALLNYLKAHSRIDFSLKTFISRYIMQSKRCTHRLLQNSVDSHYIFFVSTLWKGQDECNRARINFIRACKRLQKEGLLYFEGGLIPDAEQNTEGIEDVILSQGADYAQYLRNVQRSALCFNTPAYFGCHGWKLPEYFSMGKAILSTPFINELPIPPTHGENIFYVRDYSEQAIYEGVRTLMLDNELRTKLEQGATNYYNTVLSPKACIYLLINLSDF